MQCVLPRASAIHERLFGASALRDASVHVGSELKLLPFAALRDSEW